MPKTRPPYTAQFREQMVELVRTGRKSSELANEFGGHASSTQNWIRQLQDAGGANPGNNVALTANERQELQELRRKLRQVQMERDILAKATDWFATNGDKTFTPSTR